jgi:dienelactone hydrolase
MRSTTFSTADVDRGGDPTAGAKRSNQGRGDGDQLTDSVGIHGEEEHMRCAIALGLTLAAVSVQAKVVTKEVRYKDGDVTLVGFLARDEARRLAPGVLVVPQWMGLTDYEKGRARQLAELGYVALCADIYGEGHTAASVKEAGQLAAKFKGDRALFRSRLAAALAALRASPGVDPKRCAAIGYCFGGTGVLELARSGADVLGVVSFHGGLDSPNPADGKNIKAKVLILHGADDPYSSQVDIAALQSELKSGGVDYEMVFYGGAVHAFTQPMAGNDPSQGAAYNERADKRSWIAMKDFFHEIFGR